MLQSRKIIALARPRCYNLAWKRRILPSLSSPRASVWNIPGLFHPGPRFLRGEAPLDRLGLAR
jgi:hypothetical protein